MGSLATTRIGTFSTIAPKVLCRFFGPSPGYTLKADVYGLGMFFVFSCLLIMHKVNNCRDICIC